MVWSVDHIGKAEQAMLDVAGDHALDMTLGPKGTTPTKPSAGDILTGHLDAVVTELLGRDRDVRQDGRDCVRKMRVATRRLRSALATYRPILKTERTEPLRNELRWLGRELGSPRDAAVLRARLDAAMRSVEGSVRVGAVIQLLEVELEMRHETAHARLLAVLDGPRYFDLLAALVTLIDDPPLNDAAILPAVSEVDRLVQQSVRRVQRLAVRADASAEGVDRERALHDVRNAAKRARYAAESAVPALGKRSAKLARRMKRLQDLLGELQDSVGSRRLLREVGAVACLSHDEAFTFGVLYGREEERSRLVLQRYEPVLRVALR